VPEAGDEACAIVERDFVAAWWLLATAGDHERRDEDGLRWYHSGADEPYANAVLVTHLADAHAHASIDRLLAELRGRGAPFIWWVMPSSRPVDLADRLSSRGLQAGGTWPGFALDIDALAPPRTVPGLEIRRVSDDATFARYVEVMAPILSPSEAFTAVFAEASRRIGFAPDADEQHFLGYLEGAPVATASLVLAGGAAGIYNVTTVEAARRRGIGAAVTAAAVRAGAERGMRIATLQASDMGRPVYESLGFRHVCDFVPYRDAT
jgi:ribosomal protein S18 acetylase RimI-like enzyme